MMDCRRWGDGGVCGVVVSSALMETWAPEGRWGLEDYVSQRGFFVLKWGWGGGGGREGGDAKGGSG